MLRDIVGELYYHGNGHNYSCSESMLRAIDRYYDLKLPEELFYAASAYSGGCGHDEMCGAVASAIAALGILYSQQGHAHNSPEMAAVRKELFERFEEKFGPYRCVELKKRYHVPDRKCEVLLLECADILEDIISRNEIINKRD